MVKCLINVLRLEGALEFVIATYVYFLLGYSWEKFLLLFLLPDLSIMFYLVSRKVGALVYNVFHSYILPLALLLFSIKCNSELYTSIALIWCSHIGIDRFLGFGLKE